MRLDTTVILDRFRKAKEHASTWQPTLQRCYDVTMPNRASFTVKDQMPGARRTQELYDPTASDGLKRYASDRSQMMFGTKRWAVVKPGKHALATQNIDDANEACERYNDLIYSKLNESNFQMAIHQSLMEMAISTGVLLIKKGDRQQPFNFISIPLNEVVLEPGPDETIQNVYREYSLPIGVIEQTWPEMELTYEMQQACDKDPTQIFKIIECTIFNPKWKKPKEKFTYYVIDADSETPLVTTPMSYSPWVVFRPNVLAGEIYGRGPIYDILPAINVINQAMENILDAADYNAGPIFAVSGGNEINPFNTLPEPRSIVTIQPNGSQQPLSQLPIQASADGMLELRQIMAEVIVNALNLNPISNTPQAGDPSQTATEINTRNDEYTKQNLALQNRLNFELAQPLFRKIWHVLYEIYPDQIPTPEIDGVKIAVEFNTPVQDMANQEEVNKILTVAAQLIQFSQGTPFGPYLFAAAFNLTEIPQFFFDRNGCNTDVKANAAVISHLQQTMPNLIQQMQSGQPQNQPVQPGIPPQMQGQQPGVM